MLPYTRNSLFNNAAFCTDTPCRLVEINQFYGATYWRKLQVSRRYVTHTIDMGSRFPSLPRPSNADRMSSRLQDVT